MNDIGIVITVILTGIDAIESSEETMIAIDVIMTRNGDESADAESHLMKNPAEASIDEIVDQGHLMKLKECKFVPHALYTLIQT